ncbi:MAG: BTAD domain-containing putative transcriptional regulator [Actinomycetota bacterium]
MGDGAHLEGPAIRALGGLELEWGADSPTPSLPDKAQLLLVYLADAARPVPRSEAAGLLWSDLSEERARANLRLALTKIRRITPDAIDADRRSLRLATPRDYDVDLIEAGDLEATLRHYRGDFLAGIDADGAELFDDWVRARRHAVRATAVRTLSAAAAEAVSASEWSRAIECAARVVEIEPWNEVAHRHLMRSLAHTGGTSAALAQYAHCERVLADELGVRPDAETTALAARIENGEHEEPEPAATRVVGVPSTLTPLIGRDTEIDVIVDRIVDRRERLVSLVGPGGVGKSRVAIEVADRLSARYDSVVFVPLASVGSSAEAATMADSLVGGAGTTIDAVGRLIESLEGRRTLLILDNLEHLVGEIADLVRRVLDECPGTDLLITSREPLDLAVEDLFELRGLAVESNTADVGEAPAVRLFVDRAYRSDKTFSLTDTNANEVLAVCTLLEGVPLHLELVASRVRSASLTEILSALDASEPLPGSTARDVPARHASFQAVFDQSWNLLTASEQRALSQLSAMRGGFDRLAADALTGDRIAAPSLARKSMLIDEGGGRYRFHELVRQMAAARLDPAEVALSEIAHSRYYLERVAEIAPSLGTWGAADVVESMVLDLDNIRIAWERAIGTQQFDHIALSLDGLCKLFEASGLLFESLQLLDAAANAAPPTPSGEGEIRVRHIEQLTSAVVDDSIDALCERTLELLGSGSAHAAARGWVHLHWGATCLLRHDHETAWDRCADAATEAAVAGDRRLDASVVKLRGRLHTMAGRFEAATEELEIALGLFEEIDDVAGQCHMHICLAPAYAEQYRVWEALQSDRRSLELAKAIGHERHTAVQHANVGASLILIGDYDGGRASSARALEIARGMGEVRLEGYLVVQYAECLVDVDLAEATSLMEEGVALEREHNDEHGLIYSLVPFSRLLLRLGRNAEAKLAADELAEVAGRRDAPHFVQTARLIGAVSDLALGRREQATAEALRAADVLLGEDPPQMPWPVDSRLDIVAVLSSGHPVGQRALADAREIHRNAALSIEDPRLRQLYLERLPASRMLTRLADSGPAEATFR